jgi:hypothetical protein
MPIITGLYHRPEDAAATVKELKAAGIAEADISLVASHSEDDATDDPDVTQTAVVAGTGEAVGATIGGAAGLLAGLGILAIPGLDLVVAAGWLVAAITGAGVGAAAGSLLGALVGLGMSEEHAEQHIEHIKRGAVLVTVRADDENAPTVQRIMDSRAP